MGGRILEFNADKIYDAGRKEGEEKGRKEGEEKGRIEGKAMGKTEGESKLGRLMTEMKNANREEEAFKAASDAVFREKMYAEFNIKD